MVKIGNNIKVLLTKYSKDVIIDDIGGELILYDHSRLLNGFYDDLLKSFSFTGIKLEYSDNLVEILVRDLYEKQLEYTKRDDFLFVKKTSTVDTSDPLCVISFTSKGSVFFVKGILYAHFIEKI